MKNPTLILAVTSFLLSGSIMAQENLLYEKNMADYKNYVSKNFGIECKIPDRFIDLEKYYIGLKVNKDADKHSGSMLGPVFQSNTKECMIMFPAFPRLFQRRSMDKIDDKKTAVYPRGAIMQKIKTSLGLYYFPGHPLNNDTARIDFNEYVTTIAGKKPRDMFNADSLFIYDLPNADSVYFFNDELEKMRKEKYPYCTGLFITKKGRATMEIKFFFTQAGKKKKWEYINMLEKKIWYEEGFKPDK